MLKPKTFLPLLILALSLLAACASPPKETTIGIGEAPAWVTQPRVDQGIAATECVPDSGDFSSDRNKATSQTRQSLAQQLQTRVKAMDKAYQLMGLEENTSRSGSTFAAVSEQPTRQILTKADHSNIAYEKFNRQKHLCVMLSLGREEMKEFFYRLVERSEADISQRDEEILYQVFMDGQSQGEKE